jgi:hypothetical protein
MTRTLKATGNAFRIASLDELDQPDALCSVCNIRPRAAGGKLSCCLRCLQAAVNVERKEREARQARAREEAKSKAPPATKACRSCKIVKPLSSFSKHRLAKDGHRHDCRTCAQSERAKRLELTAEQREARKRNAARAANRLAVRAWSVRNPMAAQARRKLRRAVKSGKVQMADHCQAQGCTSTKRLQGHHADYRSALQVVWLCATCHRRAHASGVLRVKKGVPRQRSRVPKLK